MLATARPSCIFLDSIDIVVSLFGKIDCKKNIAITTALLLVFSIANDIKNESLALVSMARDDPPASSTVSTAVLLAARRPCCLHRAVKWDRNLKPKLAIMRQCTSVTDGQTDGLALWHKREMYTYITSRANKLHKIYISITATINLIRPHH